MSGYITQFGTTLLPGAVGTWNVSAVAKRNTQKVLGGIYDPYQLDDAELDLPYPIVVSAKAYETTAAVMGASLDSYRALLRKRARLWMTPFDSTQVDRWCWARCVQINETNTSANRIVQPVELIFDALSPWYGHSYDGAWNLDDGNLFDNGLYLDGNQGYGLSNGNNNITLVNNGNLTCTNVAIAVQAGYYAACSSVTISISGVAEISYTATVVAGDYLTIDCGNRTVLNDGYPDYADFALGNSHASPYWLPLAPGNNAVVLNIDNAGTNGRAYFVYSDTWV